MLIEILEYIESKNLNPIYAFLSGFFIVLFYFIKVFKDTLFISRKDKEGLEVNKGEAVLLGYKSLVDDLGRVIEPLKNRIDQQDIRISKQEEEIGNQYNTIKSLEKDIVKLKEENKRQKSHVTERDSIIEAYKKDVEYLINLIRQTGNKAQKQDLDTYLKSSKSKV